MNTDGFDYLNVFVRSFNQQTFTEHISMPGTLLGVSKINIFPALVHGGQSSRKDSYVNIKLQ